MFKGPESEKRGGDDCIAAVEAVVRRGGDVDAGKLAKWSEVRGDVATIAVEPSLALDTTPANPGHSLSG